MAISTEELVFATYKMFLGREPDSDGFTSWVNQLDSGLSLTEFFKGIQSSEEYISRISLLNIEKNHTNHSAFMLDHSQYGETQMLLVEMINSNSICCTVVDVGARGIQRSNSYDLLRHFGWRGILVEANPELYKELEAGFQGLNVEIISTAVANYTGEAYLFIGSNLDVSSLNKNTAENWGATQGQVRVSVRRLYEILEEQNVPYRFDLLSLDIEGEDANVLNDLVNNSRFRPNWIIIEASFNFQVKTLEEAGLSETVCQEYEIRGQTMANLILAYRHTLNERK